MLATHSTKKVNKKKRRHVHYVTLIFNINKTKQLLRPTITFIKANKNQFNRRVNDLLFGDLTIHCLLANSCYSDYVCILCVECANVHCSCIQVLRSYELLRPICYWLDGRWFMNWFPFRCLPYIAKWAI